MQGFLGPKSFVFDFFLNFISFFALLFLMTGINNGGEHDYFKLLREIHIIPKF